jgi:capsule polysaccharide export protein KpsE/RkpR
MPEFDNTDMLQVAMKRKFHLLGVAVVAVLIGCVISSEWVIKPKFSSTAVLYPSNLIPYSEETPSEQLLQLFQSSDVRARMIKAFNLAGHYNIDTNSRSGRSNLLLTYDENVDIRKTEFESVKIEILDTDPVLAAHMVDSIIHFVDLKARALQRQKTGEVVLIFKEQLIHKQKQMDSLEVALKNLRVKYGLLDYKTQAKEVTKSYMKSIGGSHSRELDTIVNNLQEKGGELVSATELLDKVRGDYADIRSEYDKALSDLKKELTYSNVVTKPIVADTKSYPVRWLVVLIFLASSMVLAFLLFILFESRQKRKAVQSEKPGE